MDSSNKVVSIKENVADQVLAEIRAVAEKAPAEDKKLAADIMAKAKTGKKETEILTLTPGASAILFLGSNIHNREWRPELSREYARRMTAGQWQFNNATIGFYGDGALEDGQHRLGGSAIASYALSNVVVYGISRTAIATVDDVKVRHASDAVTLEGVTEAKAKQTIIRLASSYLVKTGDKSAALKSEVDVAVAIRSNNNLLDLAMSVGEGSRQGIADPVLKATQAHTVSYLMLTGGWSEQRVREKLALFQTGVSADGEKTPYFVAAEIIKNARNRWQARERLSSLKELGVVVSAMLAAERGTKAMSASTLKTAVKKELPKPGYPAELTSEAA